MRFLRSLVRPPLFGLIGVVVLCGRPAVGGELAPSTGPALPPLPEKISSFGAAVAGDALYVYSGHVGGAHEHSKDNLSYKFSRLRLGEPSEWESLLLGPALQSPALVAHDGKLYRVGGLSARNARGEPEDLVSVTDFERFDPDAKTWTALTPLPEPRSSHDAVVVGDLLYVVGGWNLGTEKKWHDTMLVADLSQPKPTWKALPTQPFKRRALAAAARDGKVYAIGGMSEQGPSLDVHVFDPATNRWSEGPRVPDTAPGGISMGPNMNGFGCSACELDGELFLSTMDGVLGRLSDDGRAWQAVGKLAKPRFFHRLLPHGDELLAVGGAAQGGHTDSIERVARDGSSH